MVINPFRASSSNLSCFKPGDFILLKNMQIKRAPGNAEFPNSRNTVMLKIPGQGDRFGRMIKKITSADGDVSQLHGHTYIDNVATKIKLVSSFIHYHVLWRLLTCNIDSKIV